MDSCSTTHRDSREAGRWPKVVLTEDEGKPKTFLGSCAILNVWRSFDEEHEENHQFWDMMGIDGICISDSRGKYENSSMQVDGLPL